MDTSRYTNTSQIPNLKLRFIVTDLGTTDSDKADKRRNWYVSDATSTVSNPNDLSKATLSFTWSYGSSNSTVDLLKHSRWRKDDFSKKAYGEGGYGVGTVLSSSGSGSGTGGDNAREGQVYSSTINYAVSGSGGSYIRYFRYGVCGARSSSWSMSTGFVLLRVTTVSKSSLRSLVNTCVGTYMQPYYTSSTWSTYNTKLQNAYSVLGNPAATASQISTATSELTSAKNALVRNTGTATVTHKSSNGATLGTETQTYNYGDTVTAGPNTYNGYTYSSANPSTLTYKNVKSATLSWTLTYTPNPYTITYNTDGGTAITSKSYNIESTDTLPSASGKTGYTFSKWKVTTAGGNWTANATFNGGTSLTGKYGNVTLTAQWTINKSTLTVKPNGGT
ncbi:MAG: FIVAR domain-containing protein, partial [Clostridia bacterium]|nr:FIVAR domain-containing protein [Clostridia bacterium]